MSEPTDAAPSAGAGSDAGEELSRSLGSIWQRHAGGRPSTTSVEISGDVVKYVMEGAVSGIDTEPSVDESGAEVLARRARPATRTRRSRRSAGSPAPGARLHPERDEKSDLATDTYILEPVHIAR